MNRDHCVGIAARSPSHSRRTGRRAGPALHNERACLTPGLGRTRSVMTVWTISGHRPTEGSQGPMAAPPVSPVRTRKQSSRFRTKTLPSPRWLGSDLAAAMMASTAGLTNSSFTAISSHPPGPARAPPQGKPGPRSRTRDRPRCRARGCPGHHVPLLLIAGGDLWHPGHT